MIRSTNDAAAERRSAYHTARQRAQHAEAMREHARSVLRDTPTRQEAVVLALLAGGHSYESAAAELGISHHTTRSHTRSAIKKLQARNIPHAVAIALREGWIQ